LANRKSNSPWGSSYKEGLPSTAVDDSVDIDQNVRATINTGVIDVRTGQWQGITVSDPQMTGFTIAEAIPNSGTALFPDTQNFPSIDMTGYSDIFIAIKPNNGGNIGIEAVMGPDSLPFGGLTPVNAAAALKWTWPVDTAGTVTVFQPALSDGSEAVTADVWNILAIVGRLANQKNLQFKVTNSNLGESNIEFAFMRVV
tara:strand:- start:627 stop:1223 length:597 start_codon:yes stop_codon:yes gene_type:complete